MDPEKLKLKTTETLNQIDRNIEIKSISKIDELIDIFPIKIMDKLTYSLNDRISYNKIKTGVFTKKKLVVLSISNNKSITLCYCDGSIGCGGCSNYSILVNSCKNFVKVDESLLFDKCRYMLICIYKSDDISKPFEFVWNSINKTDKCILYLILSKLSKSISF